ncbi:putative chitinase 2-like Protein [Tribolium castaneum]|uniref:Putative chitinase 2-like Protein n=2 Tax=Tribolium castaneum TaxID=7070 RepID=D6WTD0_TRICA|nr:putative chitinase 2-like Protein [Tribolium castaneum]
MKSAAILALLALSLGLASSANVVCYFTSWTIYREGDGQFAAKDVDPTLCTHILYAFVGLNEDGTINILDDWEITGLEEIKHLVSLKQQNPDLKLLLSMGGWNEGSTTYSEVAKNPGKRATLVTSVLSFLKENNFDGFDLDWEYPGQRDGDEANDPDNFITLLGELKSALNAQGYLLSAAVSGGTGSIDISYPNAKAVSDNLDMINVMTYDYHGDWEQWVGQNAPLYASHLDQDPDLNVAAGIQYWIDLGADPKKINIGIGTYGRSFTLADPSNTELYAPVTGTGQPGPYTDEAGMLGYNEICALYSDWTETWDDEQKVPRRVKGDQWVGFDNVKSIQLKMQFAKEKGLGGAMVWSLDTDDFLGKCGEKYPLLKAINDNL